MIWDRIDWQGWETYRSRPLLVTFGQVRLVGRLNHNSTRLIREVTASSPKGYLCATCISINSSRLNTDGLRLSWTGRSLQQLKQIVHKNSQRSSHNWVQLGLDLDWTGGSINHCHWIRHVSKGAEHIYDDDLGFDDFGSGQSSLLP